MSLQHVHLVRHGEVQNPQNIVYGNLPGFPLSEKGRAQARAMARYLVDKTGGKAQLFSGPLERARETASIVREEILRATGVELPCEVDDRFTEADTWREGLPKSFAPIRYARRLIERGGHTERALDIARRVRSGVLHAAYDTPDDVHAIIMTHRFAIWMARVAFEHNLDAPAERYLARVFPWLHIRKEIELASVTTLVLDGDRATRIHYAEPA